MHGNKTHKKLEGLRRDLLGTRNAQQHSSPTQQQLMRHISENWCPQRRQANTGKRHTSEAQQQTMQAAVHLRSKAALAATLAAHTRRKV
jgi:hypothetical protein